MFSDRAPGKPYIKAILTDTSLALPDLHLSYLSYEHG